MRYFESFPLFDYKGKRCVDITRRVALRNSIIADPRAYYSYEVKNGQRADHISDGYYGMSDREWIVYLSTNVLDPYFDWYQKDKDFADHIIMKYGSLEESLERVKFWQNNWYDDDREINTTEYEALPYQLRNYWEPTFGSNGETVSYVRREDDSTVTTNMIVTIEVGEHELNLTERVQVFDGAELEGQAEVLWANSTHLKLHHVQSALDEGMSVNGEYIIMSREFTSNTIPIEERPYWSPVYCFEWETDQREKRKSVKLIDSRHTGQIENEMRRMLNEPR